MIHKEQEITVVKTHQETCETITAAVLIPMDRRKEHLVLVAPTPMNQTTILRAQQVEIIEVTTAVLLPDPTVPQPVYRQEEDAQAVVFPPVDEAAAEEDNSYT